jgi:uncharacterized protein (UPF0248 family)
MSKAQNQMQEDIQDDWDDYDDEFYDEYDDFEDDFNSEEEYDEYAPVPKSKIGGTTAKTTQAPTPKKKKKKPIAPVDASNDDEIIDESVAIKKSSPKVEQDENVKTIKVREKGSMQDKTGKQKSGIPVKTQKSILDRIRWDERLSDDDFVIGYLDRFLGVVESDLDSHDFAEIPLHRIYYFKYRGTVVWDRKTKVNMFKDGSIYNLIPKQNE